MLYNKVLSTWFSALLSLSPYTVFTFCWPIALPLSWPGTLRGMSGGLAGQPSKGLPHHPPVLPTLRPPILNKSPCISINQMLRQLFLESVGNYHSPRDQRSQRMKKLYQVWKGSCFLINDTQKGYCFEGELWCQDKVTVVTAVNIPVLTMCQVL